MWRLAWVAHELPAMGSGFFDANIFHPAHGTFLYSDGIWFLGAVASPAIWLGIPLPYVYSALLLCVFVANTLCMFVLARALTGSTTAGIAGGLVFAFEPYRYFEYGHLEMQATFWMPLALFFLFRVLRGGSRSDAILLSACLVGQALSGLYAAAYFATSLLTVVLVCCLFVARPSRTVWLRLALALVLSVAGAAAVSLPYWRVQSSTGVRSDTEIRAFSAEGRDYLTASRHSVTYGRKLLERQSGGQELFPGFVPVGLALAAFVPPLNATVAPIAAGLALAFDGSLGLNGMTYRGLATLSPFRAFRVAARFRMVVGLYLALMAAIGLQRLLVTLKQRAVKVAFVLIVGAAGVADFMPRFEFQEVWTRLPLVYTRLPAGAVVANLPAGNEQNWNDPIYMYWSTLSWPRLVGGASGFEPPWYRRLTTVAETFPDNAALDEFKNLGTQYFVLHAGLYRARYPAVIAEAERQARLRHVTTYSWDEGEARVYQLLR